MQVRTRHRQSIRRRTAYYQKFNSARAFFQEMYRMVKKRKAEKPRPIKRHAPRRSKAFAAFAAKHDPACERLLPHLDSSEHTHGSWRCAASLGRDCCEPSAACLRYNRSTERGTHRFIENADSLFRRPSMSGEPKDSNLSRRDVLRLAGGAAAVAGVLPVIGSARARASAAPRPQEASAADIPAAAVLEPSQFADVLAHASEKPVVIYAGFKFLYDSARVPGALYFGPGSESEGVVALAKWAGTMKHDKAVVLYCGCCPWAVCPNIQPAYATLQKMGFTNLKVMRLNQNFGADWVSKGYPTEKKS